MLSSKALSTAFWELSPEHDTEKVAVFEYNAETNHSQLSITDWVFHDIIATKFTCLIWLFLELSNPANQPVTFLSAEMEKIAIVFKSSVPLWSISDMYKNGSTQETAVQTNFTFRIPMALRSVKIEVL